MSSFGSGLTAEEVCARFDVSRESRQRLKIYERLLRRWQERINLIGDKSMSGLWHRHIGDGLQLDPLVGAGPHTIIDLGSGAGIPGLILALARPEHHVVLIERNHRKAAFLREAARQTGVLVEVVPRAVEDVDSAAYRSPKPIVVTARALAPLDRLLALSVRFLGRGLFHKGRRLDQELTEAAKSWKIRYARHPSVIDSAGSILEVLEARQIDGHT